MSPYATRWRSSSAAHAQSPSVITAPRHTDATTANTMRRIISSRGDPLTTAGKQEGQEPRRQLSLRPSRMLLRVDVRVVESLQAVSHTRRIEIEQQARGASRQLEIRNDLGLIDRMETLRCFYF